MAEATEVHVIDNTALSRFETQIHDEFAYLQYTLGKDNIALNHSYTSVSLRGKGIASALAKFALENAKEKGLQVIVHCPFVAAYLKRHPEYEPLLNNRSIG